MTYCRGAVRPKRLEMLQFDFNIIIMTLPWIRLVVTNCRRICALIGGIEIPTRACLVLLKRPFKTLLHSTAC